MTLLDARLREPREKVVAIGVEGVLAAVADEADVEGRSGRDGEEGAATALVLWVGRCRTLRRWNCAALARAFSCVRTKPASCCGVSVSVCESRGPDCRE